MERNEGEGGDSRGHINSTERECKLLFHENKITTVTEDTLMQLPANTLQ